MGIWDYISSTIDSIKRNAPDPTSVKGFCWNSYNSIKRNAPDPTSVKGLYWSSYDSVKRNAPDLTSVKGFCRSSYDNSRAAVTIFHDAIKVNAVDKLSPYLPDGETRSEIATNLAIVAAREGAKSIPGGSMVYNVVSQSHSRSSNKISKEHTEELKELKHKVKKLEKELSDSKKYVEELKDKVKKPEKELGDSKKSVEHAQMPKATTRADLSGIKNHEDLIKIFMIIGIYEQVFIEESYCLIGCHVYVLISTLFLMIWFPCLCTNLFFLLKNP